MMSETVWPRLWNYRARVRRVIDGDTLLIELDQGLHTYRIEMLRILGVNTPELRGPSRAAGLAAAEATRQWLAGCVGEWPLLIHTERADAFGRYLAVVIDAATGASLGDALLASGHAIEDIRAPKGEKP